LAQRLFPETYRPGSAVIRQKTFVKVEGDRFNQYEARLEPLDKKKRKKKKRRRVRGTKVVAYYLFKPECYIPNFYR
jgi:hypothetical protein